jgi:hypothetical protein
MLECYILSIKQDDEVEKRKKEKELAAKRIVMQV